MTKYKFLKKILDIPSPSGDEISTKELMVNNLISTKNIADSYNISTDEIGNIYFQLYNNKIFGCDICSNIMCTCEKIPNTKVYLE